MIKWVDQQTYEELLIGNWERVQADIDEAKTLRETFLPFIPDAALRYNIKHDTDTLKNWLQYVQVSFRRNGIVFSIIQTDYPRKGIFRFETDLSAFQHLDHGSLSLAVKGLIEPHYLKTPNQRKVNEWIEYLTQAYRNLEKINAENKRLVETFTNRLKEIPDVRWNKDGKAGNIERHGMTYRFSITKSSYTEHIELYWGCRTLEDFLKLSSNDYEKNSK